jgi:hypothetical protein
MTTREQDKKFAQLIFGEDKLADAIDWIRDNMNPSDVFSEDALEDWARDNEFVKEY